MADRLLTPPDWSSPLLAHSYKPTPSLWDNRLSIAPFNALLSAIQCLSDLWTLTGLHARPLKHRHSPIRFLLSTSVYLLLNAIHYAYHYAQFIFLSGIVLLLTPALLYDHISLAYFAIAAFCDSFRDFNKHLCRAYAPNTIQQEANAETHRILTPPPWYSHYAFLDKMVGMAISLLDACWLATPGALLTWRGAKHREEFRHYLRQRPPAFAVQCFDYPYLQDTSDNPCQILILAVMERIDLAATRATLCHRWVTKFAKLRSVFSFRHGRYCWVPLPISPDLSEVEVPAESILSPEERVFRMGNHVLETELDLQEETIYTAISKMASVCMRRDRPLWRTCLFQPVNADIVVRVGSESLPATSVTYMVMQIHHSLADGVGLVHSLITTVFEPDREEVPQDRLLATRLTATATRDQAKVIMESSPTSTKHIPYIYVAAFYLYHFVKSLFIAAGCISFWFLWAPHPPALFQNPPEDDDRVSEDPQYESVAHQELRPRSAVTGRRFVAPPIVFQVEEVLALCSDIGKLVGVKPTVNDLFSTCVASALGRLRSGEISIELKRQLLGSSAQERRRRSMELQRGTPTCMPQERKGSVSELREMEPFHSYGGDFGNYCQLMIPMTARVNLPSDMDNFTSLVLTRFPLPSAVSQQEQRERDPSLMRRLARYVSGDPSVSWNDVMAGKHLSDVQDKSLLLQLRHVLTVKAEMDWLKSHNARAMFFTVVCAMCKAFPDALLRYMLNAMGSKVQMFFTNVWGPAMKCKFNGRSMLSLHSWPPLRGNVTLAVKLLTYDKDLQLLIAADECEAASMFTQEELSKLTRNDLLTATSFIGEVVWQEYQKLKHSIRVAVTPQAQDNSPTQLETTPPCANTPHSCVNDWGETSPPSATTPQSCENIY